MIEDKEPNSPYGIVCPIHGKQGLSKENYEIQLSMPNNVWECPIENCEANSTYAQPYPYFDVDRFEESEGVVYEDIFREDEPWEDK